MSKTVLFTTTATLLLLGSACSGSTAPSAPRDAHQAASGDAQITPSVASPQEQFEAMVNKANEENAELEAAGMVALVRADDLGMAQDDPARLYASGLVAGETRPVRVTQTAAGHTSLNRALSHYQLYSNNTAPPSIDALAPVTFTWAAATPGETRPAALHPVDPIRSGYTEWTTDAGQFVFGATLTGSEIAMALPVDPMLGTEVIDRPVQGSPDTMLSTDDHAQRRPIDEEFVMPFRAKAQAAENPGDKFWTKLQTNLHKRAATSDLRYLFAQQDMQALLFDAARNAQEFPDTWEQAMAWSGQVPLNLVAADPADADLVIGFDGVQAYRLTLRFPSGVVLDTVDYWKKMGLTGGFSTQYSYARYAAEVGREFKTIAAFNLVSADAASLPLAGSEVATTSATGHATGSLN